MKKCISYLRVSSTEQLKGFSIDNQRSYCEKYCRDNDLDLIKTFIDEAKTATNTNRKGLIDLLNYCKKNSGQIDYLVLYRIDRLSRET